MTTASFRAHLPHNIPAAFVLYPPVLNDPTYIVGAGADRQVSLGALLEVILVVANIGTAVVLYPLLKRQNQAIATIPEFLWELSLGIYLAVKGFQPSLIIAEYERDVRQDAVAV